MFAYNAVRYAALFAAAAWLFSPAALAVGTATVQGKDALREYWVTARARLTRLHFTFDRVLYDADRNELVILYAADLNGQRSRACEFMRFDADGLVVEGEALYGAAL